MSRTSRLEQAIADACCDGAKKLELDLRAVTFIDSSGVRELFNASRRCSAHKCELSIIPSQHASPGRVVAILGLEKLLPWQVQTSA